jgi:hypothetical protein
MLIAIPSKGRANKVKTLKHLPSGVLFVPENEINAYKGFNSGSNVIGVPIEIVGITKTRNWILENANSDSVVMVDDDVKACGFVEIGEESAKHKKIKPETWVRECEKLFEVTRSIGFRIWGIATQSARRSVYPYRPFLFRSYVTASFMGICNESKIRFDESFPVKEDYEINLRCVNEDGGVVAARHIYWENSHWFDEGGCKEYRTSTMELNCIKALQKKYPGQVRRIERGGVDVSIELAF